MFTCGSPVQRSDHSRKAGLYLEMNQDTSAAEVRHMVEQACLVYSVMLITVQPFRMTS